MDVGQAVDKGALGGKSVFARVCDALGATSAFLAAVLSFIAKRSERMATGLERSARWLRSKSSGIPIGVDVAGEEWEEPAFLPDAPEPPPIPPSAFFTVKTPAQDEEWAAAVAAAKLDAEHEQEREPSEQEWEAALLAAKNTSAPAPSQPAKAETPKPVVTARTTGSVKVAKPAEPPKPMATARTTGSIAVAKPVETPKPVVAKQTPAPKIAELRVGPKAAPARATEPHIALKPAATSPARDTTPRPIVPPADPQTAAATRKAISAALRS
jgi:hypothetical protein